MDKFKKNQKGFAAFFIAFLMMAVVFGIAVTIFILTYGEQKIIKNIIKSSQVYYVAEAGIEDALLRLEKDMKWSSSYTLNVGKGSTAIAISDIVGGSRTITSEGDVLNRIRKISVAYEIASEKISFYYGAQAGDGGVIMDDGSKISGNIFSNGSVNGSPNTKITGTVWVANNGNKISGLNIGEDVYVHTCKNSEISGILTYVSGGSVVNCTSGGSVKERPNEISPKDLPISQEQINNWKNEAAAGGTITGNYLLSGKSQDFLGPQKIDGSFKIQDQAQLFITGTIWVTGDIVIQNKSRVRLDSNSYGSFSGKIIADGKITLQDQAKALGSGEAGSYLLFLSTAALNPAIIIQDTFEADILYTQNGWILVQNSADVREVTGYGIHLKNNAEIIYEIGLENASFSSGPGGSWEVTIWKEIE